MRALIETGTVLAGSAEAIPLEDASVDAVLCGEAFHWFEHRRALEEIARVLVPRGGLGIIWTHWWETEPALPAAGLDLLREPYERFAAELPDPWDEAFEGSRFEPLRDEPFAEELVLDADALLELYSTTSSLAALEQEERAALFVRVRPLLTGPYRLPVKHGLAWTRLRVG
jgi:SAM-dependent methyltransferase